MTVYGGIDPGKTGCLALLGDPPQIYDFQVSGESILVATFLSMINRPTDLFVLLEKTHAMPANGILANFSSGRSLGACEAVLRLSNCSWGYVDPKAWKKHYGLTSDKKASLALARERWGDTELLTLEKHHNRAEALLIAEYARHMNED